MKNQVKFKVGDLVYCPKFTNKIVRLEHRDDKQEFYTLQFVYDETSTATFADNGLENIGSDLLPIIFHATQENYELLSKLYPNVEFEAPPKRKEPREIIQALLDDGNAGVLCWVSDIAKTPKQANSVMAVIVKIDSRFIDFDGDIWLYATPITPIPAKLNQTIIDFVNGEVVLENENE